MVAGRDSSQRAFLCLSGRTGSAGLGTYVEGVLFRDFVVMEHAVRFQEAATSHAWLAIRSTDCQLVR